MRFASVVYIPFSARSDDSKVVAHERLVEGVPPYVRTYVLNWCRSAMLKSMEAYGISESPELEFIVHLGLDLRIHWPNGLWEDPLERTHLDRNCFGEVLSVLWEMLDDEVLDLVTYLLEHPQADGRYRAQDLDTILERAGSAYGVLVTDKKKGRATLIKRTDPSALRAAEMIIADGVPGADELAGAWSALYGRNPDFSRAHDLAIKAIEGALWKTVVPRNPKARIGTIASTLYAQGAKWTMGFDAHFERHLGKGHKLGPGSQPTTNQGMLLGAMVQQVLSGQVDHHNTGPNAGAKITKDAATAAVALATAVLQMTRAETIRKV